ncbi:MAG: amidohydrolase family protein [Pirellulaceae bacterium]|jgi:cytosine/adenosine deaminase-related metal-dependent hydrolase|nr:amidohydrolase family protein [Pirellulaceae bacterium]HJN10467.1 amidohydrolase family protein [Pirellulaceae bacterium]
MTNGRFTVRARYLFPCDAAPSRNACLTVQNGRIVAVGSAAAASIVDLGQVAILPGLVNAHTHLEFSKLSAPLGSREMPFPDWVRRVIAWRNEQSTERRGSDNWRNPAIEAGICESVVAGVTTLGEIATLPVVPLDRYGDFSGVAFLELLGLRDESHDALIAAAQQFTASSKPLRPSRWGLSPHAPYTVSLRLLERIVQLSVRQRLPVTMHLAETRDELELLDNASGPLFELLRDLGAWQTGAIPSATRPLHYLESLAKAHRSLVIHGNYLDRAEIDWVARHRGRMSVVYCPRTHDYFGHDRYPLTELLAAGVRVAIGTDSRASNPDLSLLNELRFAARTHPEVALDEILRMGTIAAAAALGMDDHRGSLTVGKHADFVILPIGDEEPADPYELIMMSEAHASAVFQAGIQVCGDGISFA